MESPARTDRRYTVEEYLQLEMESEEKHDYIDGQIVSMAGGTARHSLITANIIGELHARLKGKPCRVYDSNLRVAMARGARYSYPDLSILCEDPLFDPRDKNRTTITNPRAVIEVLSPGSEATDRGEKFQRYVRVASLHEYILVLQTKARFESFFRQPDGSWLFSFVDGLEATAQIRSANISLPLKTIYTNVEFDPEPEEMKQAEGE